MRDACIAPTSERRKFFGGQFCPLPGQRLIRIFHRLVLVRQRRVIETFEAPRHRARSETDLDPKFRLTSKLTPFECRAGIGRLDPLTHVKFKVEPLSPARNLEGSRARMSATVWRLAHGTKSDLNRCTSVHDRIVHERYTFRRSLPPQSYHPTFVGRYSFFLTKQAGV
jgi:hypothetical protein